MSAHKFPGRHTEERDRLKKHTDRPKTKYSTVLNLKDITEPPSLERLYELWAFQSTNLIISYKDKQSLFIETESTNMMIYIQTLS